MKLSQNFSKLIIFSLSIFLCNVVLGFFSEVNARLYSIGETENFWVQDSYFSENNIDDDGDGKTDEIDEYMYEIQANLLTEGEHSYIFVEAANLDKVSESDLNYIRTEFDNIYENNLSHFGDPSDNDGNSKIIILIFDIRDCAFHDKSSFAIGGYFWGLHQFPTDPDHPEYIYSEYKEIIHIDIRAIKDGGTLAHEFQHLQHFARDPDEKEWVNEGFSDLAIYLNGYGHPTGHIKAFEKEPYNSLTKWPEIGYEADPCGASPNQLIADYGAAYSFIFYLVAKYGGNDQTTFIRNVVEDDANSEEGIQNHLSGIPFSTVFRDWVIANYFDNSKIDPKYEYENLDINISIPNSHTISGSSPMVERLLLLNRRAVNYIEFYPDWLLLGRETLQMKVNGPDNKNVEAWWIREDRLGNLLMGFIPLDPITKEGKVEIKDFSMLYTKKVTLILMNMTSEDDNLNFIYSGGLLKPLDLIFVIDTTGSMWDDIANVKASATEIVNNIDAKVSDYRIAVVSYEDFPVSPYGTKSCGDAPYHPILGFTNNKAAIISAIQGLSLRCGADWPEAVYSALIRSINTEGLGEWRDGVAKWLIVMGDAPPHDPEPFTGYRIKNVVDAAEAVDPASISAVSIGWDSTAYAYFSTLAEATGGKVFSAPRASDVVEALMAAIETALQSPIAEAGGPYTGTGGLPITFDASGSYDLNGTIVSYEWDWNNDGTYDDTTTSPTITHTWATIFTGTIRLRVTDNDGLTGIDTASVEVTVSLNQPSTANAGPDQILECTSPTGTSATLDGSASTDPDGDPLTYSWTGCFGAVSGLNPTVDVPLGVCSVDLVVNDGQVSSDIDSVTIKVQDTTSPNLQCPSNILDECTWPSGQTINLGTPTVSDTCSNNIAVSNNAPALFTLGTTPVIWTATDEYGNISHGIQSVSIMDTIQPQVSLNCSPSILWPPNHNMVEIFPTVNTIDICDASVNVGIYQITMNEGEETNTYDLNFDTTTGDGRTTNDIQVTSDGHIYLRAERSGNNPVGRKYTIIYKSIDDSGNSSTASCEVIVPHDMR